MNKIIVSTVLVITQLSASAYAQLSFDSLMPKAQIQGLKDYKSVLVGEVNGGSNSGFIAFNKAFVQESPCFENLAAEFYLSIAVDDKKMYLEHILNSKKTLMLKLIMTTEDAGLKPGWLWERAMAFAKGDKLLAMQMIGICGHDDANSANVEPLRLRSSSTSSQAFGYTKEEVERLSTSVLNEVGDVTKAAVGIQTGLKDYLKQQVDFTRGIKCPLLMSAMYYPKSLDKDADLTDAQKTKIANIEAPTMGAKVLPAKYYHVIGEAFASCYMVKRGVPDFVANAAVVGAINAYRSGRLCEHFGGTMPPLGQHGKSVDQIVQEVKTDVNNREACKKPENKGSELCSFKITQSLGSDLLDGDMPDAIREKKILNSLTENDAAEIFKADPAFQLSNKCQGPQLTMAIRNFLSKADQAGTKVCPPDLEKSRCERATHKFKTYLADFEWSEAQHLAGLKFAQKNCPPYNPARNPEVVACEVLQSQGAGTSGSANSPQQTVK